MGEWESDKEPIYQVKSHYILYEIQISRLLKKKIKKLKN